MRAALEKRAVACPQSHAFRGPIPAAWVINLPGGIIRNLLNMGLYIDQKKQK
jgi:hypothetical protein